MSKKDVERQEAIEQLRGMIKPGDTVYTILRHVSRSGMTRGIDVYTLEDNKPVWITAYVGKAIDQPQPMDYWRKSMGLKIGGCGMDMGFHVVNSLSYALYGKGYQCLGDGKCPSNYHVNHRDTINCPGEGEQFCYQSDTLQLKTEIDGEEYDGRHANVVPDADGKGEHICATCKGMGRIPNPEGKERFDLLHTDGYALKHAWL